MTNNPKADGAASQASDCPQRQAIAQFSLGNLPQEQWSAIAMHLGECSLCGATMQEMEGQSDAVIDHLRRPPPANEHQDEPAYQEGLSFVKELLLARQAAVVTTTDSDTARKSRDPLVGRTTLGTYKLLEPIGSGGMGAVYRAQHTRLQKIVAIKVLPLDRSVDPQAVERFNREMQAVGRLEHPNIVRAYDAGESDGIHFLAMEFVAGSDLTSLIKSQGPCSVAQAVDYVVQAGKGLEFAHAQGIIHRDIKPSNLILAKNGQIRVLDLGLARLNRPDEQRGGPDLTQSHLIMGTADYMAPEHALDTHQADQRADIYSLGCTLFFLLTGRPPYQGDTTIRKLVAHRDTQIPSLCEERSDVPRALNAVFRRMVAKELSDRYQSMSEVITALESIRPLVLQPPGSSRSRVPLWVAVLLLTVLAGLGVFWGPQAYRIITNQGQLIVETDDPDVEVVVTQDGQVVRVVDTKTNASITLKAGRYALDLAAPAEGLTLSAQEFTLQRGGKTIVHVSLAPLGQLVVQSDDIGGTVLIRRGNQQVDQIDLPQQKNVDLAPGAYALTLADTPANVQLSTNQVEITVGKTSTVVIGEIAGFVGQIRQLLVPDVQILSVAFSPDGRFALTGNGHGFKDGKLILPGHDYQVRLWDLTSGHELRRFEGPTSTVWSVAFSPNGRKVLAGSGDGSIFVWDTDSGQPSQTIRGERQGYAVAFSEDCAFAVGDTSDPRSTHRDSNRHHLELWNTESGQPAGTFTGHTELVAAVCFSPDGRKMLSGGGGEYNRSGTGSDYVLRLWDIPSGNQLARLEGHTDQVRTISFSPDGRQALSGGMDRTIRIWDLEAGWEVGQLLGHRSTVFKLEFLPDGQRALSCGDDKQIILWDLLNGKPLTTFTGFDQPARCLAVSRDGRYALSGHNDGSVRLWRLPVD